MKRKSYHILWRANRNSSNSWTSFFRNHRFEVWEQVDRLKAWFPEIGGRGKWISTIEIRNNREKRIYAKTYSELKSKSKKFSQNYPNISELKRITFKCDLEYASIWK